MQHHAPGLTSSQICDKEVSLFNLSYSVIAAERGLGQQHILKSKCSHYFMTYSYQVLTMGKVLMGYS